MIISVASGKGGTGKTLVATSLALSLKHSHGVVLLDCDVEEPNDHVFLQPEITGSKAVSILVPKIGEDKCTYCGRCAEVCTYHEYLRKAGKQGLSSGDTPTVWALFMANSRWARRWRHPLSVR